MKASPKEVELTKQSDSDAKTSLTFDFQYQGQKLVVKAQYKSSLYACTCDPDSKVTPQKIQKNLLSSNFDLITVNNEVLKLQVGGLYYLELKSQEELVINKLRSDIEDLRDQLECQQSRSAELEALIKASKISELMTRFSQLDERLNQLEQFNSQSNRILKVLQKVTLLQNNCFKLSEWTSKSKVVTTTEEANNIDNFFDKARIEYVQLLYRASENGFSAHEFHGKCDHIPGTLVVGENEFGKKIGGYNSLVWNSSNAFKPDQTEGVQSFIFSLTNNHKFNLLNSDNAIYDLAGMGPVFGADDLYIVNYGNINPSKANINVRYNNPKYTANNVGSWKSFTGNPSNDKANEFKLKEWEVWKVIFHSEEKEQQVGNKKIKPNA